MLKLGLWTVSVRLLVRIFLFPLDIGTTSTWLTERRVDGSSGAMTETLAAITFDVFGFISIGFSDCVCFAFVLSVLVGANSQCVRNWWWRHRLSLWTVLDCISCRGFGQPYSTLSRFIFRSSIFVLTLFFIVRPGAILQQCSKVPDIYIYIYIDCTSVPQLHGTCVSKIRKTILLLYLTS